MAEWLLRRKRLKEERKKMGKKKVSHEDCFDLVTSDLQESGTHEADGGKDGGGVWERTIKMKTEKS